MLFASLCQGLQKWLPNLQVSHPSNLRLWQRNPSGDHRTGGQCIPVAGLPALSMVPCASHPPLSPSLTLFASTLDGLGASLVALPLLCACGLQFQAYNLDELQPDRRRLVLVRGSHFVVAVHWFGGSCFSFIGRTRGGSCGA